MTVLTPHASGVPERWQENGVEAMSFRYAPEQWEVLGYGRSLSSDETIKMGPRLVAPLYLLGARKALQQLLRERQFDLLHAHWVVPNGLVAAPLGRRIPLAIGLHGSDVFLAERAVVRGLVGQALGSNPEDYPKGSRMTLRPEPYEHLVNEKIFSALQRFRKAAEDRGVSMGSLAMAWVLANPLTTAIITGPRRPEHLDMAEAALDVDLSEDERAELAATFTP